MTQIRLLASNTAKASTISSFPSSPSRTPFDAIDSCLSWVWAWLPHPHGCSSCSCSRQRIMTAQWSGPSMGMPTKCWNSWDRRMASESYSPSVGAISIPRLQADHPLGNCSWHCHPGGYENAMGETAEGQVDLPPDGVDGHIAGIWRHHLEVCGGTTEEPAGPRSILPPIGVDTNYPGKICISTS